MEISQHWGVELPHMLNLWMSRAGEGTMRAYVEVVLPGVVQFQIQFFYLKFSVIIRY